MAEPQPSSTTTVSTTEPATSSQRLTSWLAEYGLTIAVVVAFISHFVNVFNYPLYLGDEGIYLEQAWAVLREGALAPYTYVYDHAPAGWLLVSFWEFILPGHFDAFGMAMNSARLGMVLLDVLSTILLYRVALRLTESHFVALATCLIFNLSPLGIYYQRMVLLDNIMVFWVLLSLDLLLAPSRRLVTTLAAGFVFGLAVLTKENALFFVPIIGYMLYHNVRDTYRVRFSLVGFSLCALMLISLYPLYALLKGEFFLSPNDAHVSMLSTFAWQMGRKGGSVLDPNSQFWEFFWAKWWQKDPLIIVVGTAATFINLVIGLRDRARNRNFLIVSALSLAFILYLARGSVIIDFYVVPLLPFFALNVGLVLWWFARARPRGGTVLASLVLVGLVVGFVAQSHDEYFVNQTQLQVDQLAFVRQNVPDNAQVLIDDDIWVDLHEPHGNYPVYPDANSHWKIASDPAIQDKLLHNNWQNLDYLVMSNQLDYIFQLNDEQLAMNAYDHSRVMARFVEGDVTVEVRQVVKNGSSS